MTIKKLKKPRKIYLNKSRSINRKNRKSKYKRKSKRIIKKSKKRSKKRYNKRSKKISKKRSVMVGGAEFDEDDFLTEITQDTPKGVLNMGDYMNSHNEGQEEEEQRKEAEKQARAELWEFYLEKTSGDHNKEYNFVDFDGNVLVPNSTPFSFMNGITESQFLDLNNADINSKETSLRMIKQGFDMKYKQV